MSIVLNSSSGGSVTIAEPATASNFTQTLPAADGTVAVLDGSNNLSVAGNLSFNSGYGSSAVAYGCRAWVNFDGTGTPAIRGSGNVSSITDNGTGDYTINLTNALVDTNGSVVIGQSYSNTRGDAAGNHNTIAGGYMATTSTVNVQTVINSAGAYYDVTTFSVAIFR
jgi:hypothetical protein